jgi:hypothetical protein
MIVDLRDYTTTPDRRDQLVERCESLFFPEQERLGARFLGVFRDASDPQRYVFLRAMPDLATRQRILTAFYSDGELWRVHREEVNGWLVDSDNVLLVRPLAELAPPATGPSVVAMLAHVGREAMSPEHAATLRQAVDAAVTAAGGRVLATFATDPAENNYPRHPIRTGEHGLVWFATFAERQPMSLPAITTRWLLPTPGSRMR